MITSERIHDGTLVLSALVATSHGHDTWSYHSPWRTTWYCRRKYQGYTLKEAKALYRESLTRDGLVIVKD
jgi:hypothetical protein